VLHKGGGASRSLQRQPKVETPTHFISMGLNEDLDQGMRKVLRVMDFFHLLPQQSFARTGVQFGSLAMDLRVTLTMGCCSDVGFSPGRSRRQRAGSCASWP
jgi:hypothetical protein